jgi:hypothetical protein
MVINNVDKLKSMMSFTEKDDFYFLQVFKRRKDNPDLGRDQIVLGSYYIDSLEDFDKKIPQIITLCDTENARAYLRVNKRNYGKLSFHFLKRIVELMASNNYKAMRTAFDSIAGEFHSDPDKKWIVDVDWDNLNTASLKDSLLVESKIQYLLGKLQKEANREPLLEKIYTKNGMHFITRPFNLMTFRGEYPKIDVHKDNPTLLYCP